MLPIDASSIQNIHFRTQHVCPTEVGRILRIILLITLEEIVIIRSYRGTAKRLLQIYAHF